MTGDDRGATHAAGQEAGQEAGHDGREPRRTAPDLFAGPGEMRARARAVDWAANPLGPVDGWPAALRTAVRLMLDAPVATSLWVGPAYILLYNDAYAPILGAKHPAALGRSGAAVWDELWPALEPDFARVRAGGPPVFADEALLRMERLAGGEAEDAWFTYALSALTDEEGRCLAVYNVAVEVTGRVLAERQRAAARAALEMERARLSDVFRRAPSFLAVYRGADHVFDRVNDAYYQLVGHDREILGKPLLEALPEVRGQGFDALLDRVLATGEPMAGREVPVRLMRTPGAPVEERYVDVTYLALTEADGTRAGVIAHGTDVTAHVAARREVERLLAESEAARVRAEASERRVRELADAAEAAAAQLGEQALELELANQQLHDNAAELELSNSELQAAAIELEQRTTEAERARVDADTAGRRLAFLADASERLAASRDYETTIREIVALAVPMLADWALYTVDAHDGTLRIVASRHADAAKDAFVAETARRYPIRADEPAGAARVLRTGEPEVIPDVPDAVLEAVARDAEHLALLRAVGFRSVMTVPVSVQGRVLGALGFVTGASGRRYGPDDVAFAQELARRAATAVEQARLHAEAETARREAEAERVRTVAILETMADAHFVLDADFRFVTVNAASERLLARPRAALLGRTLWEAFPAAAGTIFEASYRRVVAERVEAHFTGPYADDTLDIVPEVDAYPTVDGGVAVFWRDVAPRERAEAALRASEQRLRDVFEQAPVAVAVLSGPDHVYTAVSPMYARTPGLGRPLLGLAMRDAFPEVVGTGYLEALDRVYHTGVPYSATERPVALARPDDGVLEERYFNIGYQPLRDGAGRVYAVASVAYDVTDQVVARREVEAARAEAERQRAAAEAANAAKSQFLSTMSHELRTPLNAIGGYTDLLTMGLRGVLTEPQRQDMERIRRANQHLMSLVTDILNFARLDAGQIEYRLADFELASIVADLEPLVQPQFEAKRIAFDHDGCAPDTPERPHLVRADPEKLRQILLNLLGNAVKFTEPGGRVALACEIDAAAGVVRVRVSDTGRGIPPAEHARIFEPFVQVDRHRTHESQQGVGLGLAISRDLARGMGGDLAVESVVGEGSTFTLTLPAA